MRPSSFTNGDALQHSTELISHLFGDPRSRPFDVQYWNGMLERGAAEHTSFTLTITRPGALRRMLWPPSELSIVEAYLSGDLDVHGELEEAVTLAETINQRIKSPRILASIARHVLALPADNASDTVRQARATHTVGQTGRAHVPARDQAAIRYHYDVGNDFYALWLDARMVYSCAYFRTPDTTLDDAQVAKLDLICRKLRLRAGDRLLDVGCGWGGLIMHAVKHYGVTGLGITLSEAQASLARERIKNAGLTSRCRVEVCDYRELPGDILFDKIASVGMIEHVGAEQLPVYFAALYRALAPRGLLLNHGIVSIDAARPRTRWDWVERRLWQRDAFIDQYVFPDGKLVPLSTVIASAEGSGFETRDVESWREHYARTLRHWGARLAAHASEAIALTDARTYRTWRLYMTASAHAFTQGTINVVQTLLAKPDGAGETGLPQTREDLYRADGVRHEERTTNLQ